MALHLTIRKCIISRASSVLECKTLSIIPNYSYSTGDYEYNIIDKQKLSTVRRGTGLRSSFNGITCTVFGGTGFIGESLVTRLGRGGTQIIAPYRGTHYKALPLKVAGDLGQVLFCRYSIRDDESIRKAVKYSDVVVNLVGKDFDTWNFKLEEVHIDGARRIARICREMGVKKLIHVSAMGASPNPKEIMVPGGSRFMKTKWAGEQAVREEFPDAIIVRPSEVFGENDRFFEYYGYETHLIGGKLYLHEAGKNTVKQPVYVDDAVEGLYELVIRPNRDVKGKTYQFVGPVRYNLGELCDYLYEIMWKNKQNINYERLDSRISAEFNVVIHLRDRLHFAGPNSGVTIERFERENTNDTLDKSLPVLADLDVELHTIDRYVIGLLRAERLYSDYIDDVLERDIPQPPPPAVN